MGRRNRGGGGGSHETAGSGAERWLLTYADMITLLLALFILLFAMSTIDVQRFEALRRTLSQSFRGQVLKESGAVIDGSRSPLNPDAPSMNVASQTVTPLQQEAVNSQASSFSTEKDNLKKQLKKENLSNKLEVTTNERGVVIRIAGDSLFESGSAQIREEAIHSLITIAHDIAKNKRTISVEGHTDGAPISNLEFADNWELSAERARVVLRLLGANNVPFNKMHMQGWADTVPIVEPRYPEQDIAENRRVEIIILASPAVAQTLNGTAVAPIVNPVAPGSGGENAAFKPIPSIIEPLVGVSKDEGS